MRVHPSIFSQKGRQWQYPAAVGLLLFLLILNLWRGPKQTVNAATQAAPLEKKIEVLVVREALQPGQPLEKAKIVLERRPVNTLPSDAVTTFDALKGKVAAGPIPAGYPLAAALLADPVAVVPVSEKQKELKPEDPIETLLKEIEQDTVAVSVTMAANPPGRGSRIALMLSNPRGEPIVVVEDCWISKASGRDALLRLEPQQALLLQSAKGYGNFNFIEIPLEGPSPYAGKGVANRDELVKLIEGEAPKLTAANADEKKPKMKGYAWITGEGVRYGLESDGTIKVVRPNEDQ